MCFGIFGCDKNGNKKPEPCPNVDDIVHGNCFAKVVTGDAFTLLRFDTFFFLLTIYLRLLSPFFLSLYDKFATSFT